MNKNLKVITIFFIIGTFFCIFPILGAASECVYEEGYSICSNAYTDGIKTYLRWDGIYRPYNELNFTSLNWTYKVEEYENYYLITTDNISFRLPKKSWISYDFQVNKIKETMHVPTLQSLIDRSVVHNATVRYIPLEFSPSQVAQVDKNLVELGRFKTGDFWIRDNGTEFFDNETNSTYMNYSYYDVDNHYELKIINEEIRLYFDDLPWFQNANYPLLIDPSWTLNGSIGHSWINVSHENTTSVQATGNIELRQLVDDYVSYWRFDEGFGTTVYDENETNTNDGTITDDEGDQWVSGYYGDYALDFDGADDYVDCGSDASLNITDAITVEAWVKPATIDCDNFLSIVDRTNPGGWNYGWILLMWCTDDKFYFYIDEDGDDWKSVKSDVVAIADMWYHVVGRWDGSTARIFVNGILQSESAAVNKITYHDNSNTHISKYYDREFNGIIDDVRIYNRALLSAEINQTMNNSHHWAGNLTSIEKDAGSEYIWTKIRFGGEIPDETNVTIYFNSSSDNGISDEWSGWQLVQFNVSEDVNYTIPSAYQERYGNWRFALNTSNSSSTPLIHNITLYSESNNEISVTLYNGWNIFAWTNGTIANASHVASIIGSNCTYIVERNKTTGEYVSFNPSFPSVNNFDIERGLGYYVNVNNTTNVAISNLSTEYNTTLYYWWNIIGWTNSTNATASYVSNSIGNNCTYVTGRNETTGKYVSYTHYVPDVNNFNVRIGRGYYVFINNETIWSRK